MAPLSVGLLWLTKCSLDDPFIGFPEALDVEIKIDNDLSMSDGQNSYRC
jgi:hypothetical protein